MLGSILDQHKTQVSQLLKQNHLYPPCAEPCQDDNNRNCTLDMSFDKDTTQCVTTTLNCVSNDCEAEINMFIRDCQFINIGVNESLSQPIDCCVCAPGDGPLTWGCTIITPSLSLLPSGECCNSEPIQN